MSPVSDADNIMISIIICSIDERKFAAVSKNYADILAGEQYEIVGIHDAMSLSDGYNRGAQQSRGKILIFCHDDIEIVTPDFKEKICKHLECYDLVGVAGTSRLANFEWTLSGQPHIHGVIIHMDSASNGYVMVVFGAENSEMDRIEALDGVFMAMKRSVWEQIRFDEKLFDGFHGYDLDFTYSAHLAGFRVAVCSDIGIIHQSIGRHDDEWKKYRSRFMEKYRGILYQGEVGGRELGAIYVMNRDEIMEMMQPDILRRVTNDIRTLAIKKMAQGLANTPKSGNKRGFWQFLKTVLGIGKG